MTNYDWLTLSELAQHLGRDQREIERLADRQVIPGRKRDGEWRFHSAEITHWLEREMHRFTDSELAAVEQAQRSDDDEHELPFSFLLKPDTVEVPLHARTKRSVIEEMIAVAARSWAIWNVETVTRAVTEREDLMSTALPGGIALPHPRQPLPDALGDSVVAFGRTMSGIPFGASDNSLSDLFFLILCRDLKTHLYVLARLGRMLQNPALVRTLRETTSHEAAYQLLCDADREVG
jgi:PTS system nitrogen regulatory IIA component